MSLYNKNCVITGLLDSYCLPCEVRLGTEDDVKSHIAELRHKENLDSMHYLDEHKDDCIRKVPQGYYCEYCNKLFSTAFNVRFHVIEGEHRRCKETQWLQEQGDVVIVLNQLTVDGDSWHGLVDGACALCNSEYLDKAAHKTIPMHLLKLIQSNVELHTSGAIYRKRDDIFHCLICNAIFPLKTFVTHFEQPDHLKSYKKCCESFKNVAASKNEEENAIAPNANVTTHYAHGNTTVINEISYPKSIQKAFDSEREIDTSVENQQVNFQPQATTNNITSRKTKGKPFPTKNSKGTVNDKIMSGQQFTNNKKVSKREKNTVNEYPSLTENVPTSEFATNKNNYKETSGQQYTNNIKVSETDKTKENHSEVIAEERFHMQQITEALHEIKRGSLSQKENENYSVNCQEITGRQITNNYQVSERETNKISENYSEVMAPESFYTQHITDTLHEVTQVSFSVKENGINYTEISAQQSINNEQFPERTTNDIGESYTDVIDQESIKTKQTTETLQKATQGSLVNNDTKVIKEISEQQSMYNEQNSETYERDRNHSTTTAEQTLQTQQTVENNLVEDAHKLMSKKEKAAIIAKVNKIRYKESSTRAFCSICQVLIPSSLKNIKRHVENIKHQKKIQQVLKYASNVITTQEFVEQITFVNVELLTVGVIINNTYCLDLWSYLLMTNHHSYIRCHVCEVNFNVGLFEDHRSSETHHGALEKTPFVCSLTTEFVREVQPGYYHCGFCNMFEGSWRGLRQHCQLQSHLKQKALSAQRLEYLRTVNKEL